MTTSKTSRKTAGSLLSGRFKSQRTAQVDGAFAERTRQLEERAQQLTGDVVLEPVSTLRLDGGTQPRVSTDAGLVDAYAERMEWSERLGQVVDLEGQPFDPITFYDDGQGSRWLADGFHRVLAARKLGIETFQARRILGDQHAAFVHSLGANATHGKPRSNADKRRAVERALSTAPLRKMTDRRLSSICKVSNRFVSTVRAQLERSGEIPFEAELEKSDGSVYERLDGPPEPAATSEEEPALVAREPILRSRRAGKKSKEAAAARATQAVIFAMNRNDFRAQLDACGEALSEYAVIMTPYPARIETLQGADSMIRARLSAQTQMYGPWPVYVRDHDRIYVMWSTQESMPVSTTTELLGAQGGIQVWGEATEPWGKRAQELI